MINKCPGQDDRKISAEFIACPACGYKIELFSDEIKARCPKCKVTVYRQSLPSCINWCACAKDCVGLEKYSEFTASRHKTVREDLLKELEDYFGKDAKRITHARKVMGFAEELLRQEGGDWQIVIPAAILHDVGIKAAEEKHGSCAGNLQEKEGPEIARRIMLKYNLKKTDIEEICAIIAHHHTPGVANTLNFKILYDADWLVNLKDECGLGDKEKLKKAIEKVFLTESGKELAKKVYLSAQQ